MLAAARIWRSFADYVRSGEPPPAYTQSTRTRFTGVRRITERTRAMTRRATTRAAAAVAAAKPLRTTGSVITLAVAAAGIGLGGAPLAAAGPAPESLESRYLLSLELDHNVKLPTAQHKELAVL